MSSVRDPGLVQRLRTTGRTRVRRAERRVAAGLDDNHDDNDNNAVGGEGATEA